MAAPFPLTTADPRFNPTKERVTVNGYAFVPAAEHERRVAELLEANNRYLERAREAERTLAVLATAGKTNRG